jgi:arsenate reductase-like glutaredoxin family protein
VRAWLHEKGVDVEERDFFRDPLSEVELSNLLGDRNPSQVFAWGSPSFKALGVPREALDDTELIRLMLQEPRLIRRPLIEADGELIIGGAQKALDEAFS